MTTYYQQGRQFLPEQTVEASLPHPAGMEEDSLEGQDRCLLLTQHSAALPLWRATFMLSQPAVALERIILSSFPKHHLISLGSISRVSADHCHYVHPCWSSSSFSIAWAHLTLLTSTLKTEAPSKSETLLSLYKTTYWYNPKDMNLNTHLCKTLKSYTITYLTSGTGSILQDVTVIQLWL